MIALLKYMPIFGPKKCHTLNEETLFFEGKMEGTIIKECSIYSSFGPKHAPPMLLF